MSILMESPYTSEKQTAGDYQGSASSEAGNGSFLEANEGKHLQVSLRSKESNQLSFELGYIKCQKPCNG